jgi:hypothetical protein
MSDVERAMFSIGQLRDYSYGSRPSASGANVVVACDPLSHREQAAIDYSASTPGVNRKFRHPSGETFHLERASRETLRIALNFHPAIHRRLVGEKVREWCGDPMRPVAGCNWKMRINYNVGPRVEGNKNQWTFDLVDNRDFYNPLRRALVDLQCGISEAIRLAGAVFAGDERKDGSIRRDVEFSVGDPELVEENLRVALTRASCRAYCISLASSLGVRLPFGCLQDPEDSASNAVA